MRKRSGTFTITIALALNVLTACSGVKMRDVQVKDFSQYNTHQEQKGVRVAVDPYIEKERLKEFFGTNLLSVYGILPVHVVVENGTNQPLLIQKNDIVMLPSDNSGISHEPPAYVNMPIRHKWNKLDHGWMTLIGVALFPLPAALAAPAVLKVEADYASIMRNINEKSLHDKSIYNGERHDGFVYFQLKDNVAKGTVPKVRVNVKNLKSDETLSFTFDVNLSGVKRKTTEVRNEQ